MKTKSFKTSLQIKCLKEEELQAYRTKKWQEASFIFGAAIQPLSRIPRRKETHSPARKLFHTEDNGWTKQGGEGGKVQVVQGVQYLGSWLGGQILKGGGKGNLALFLTP